MALSFVEISASGSTNLFSFSFSYTAQSEIKAYVDGVEDTSFTFNNSQQLALSSTPTASAVVRIERVTDLTTRAVDFQSGSILTEADLDLSAQQVFNSAQEAKDKVDGAISVATDGAMDALNKRLKNLADPTSAQEAVTKNYLENTWLSTTDKATLTSVNNNIANINAVNSNSTNINSAVSNATNINTVATNIGSVNTVATDITKVIAVANDLQEAVSEIETVADDLNEASSEIDVVATNIASVNTVGGAITNINTVAGISSDVTTVAGLSSAISTVNSNSTNINAVGSNSANINIVAGNNTNINTVAGANANITTVATNIGDVNTFANRYRIASSAPTSSLDAGDLYFDTTTNTLNVYSGSSWQATGESAQRSVTTHNVTSAGNQTISVTYTVGLVDIYLNGLKLNISEGDATASNGTSVTVNGCSIGDVIEVVALSPFNSANYGTASSKNVGTANDNVPVFTANGLDLSNRDLITTGKVLYANMYSSASALPSASTYHGMFAHTHDDGKAVYSHAGSWIPLAKESDLSSYLTTSNASSTYLTQSNATSTYLTQASATSTYAGLAGATFTGSIKEQFINVTSTNTSDANYITSSAIQIDASTANNFAVNVAGTSPTLSITNLTSGKSNFITIEVTYGGGTITWPSSVDWNAGTAPTQSSSGVDLYILYTRDGGTTILGFTAGQAMA